MDIVKRLRGDYGVPVPFTTTPICHEAADEIERLRQQNAELVEALQTISEWQPSSATQPRQKIIDNMKLYASLAIAKATGVK